MFDRFRLWLDTDPKATRKIIFWVVAALVIVLVIGIFIFLNTRTSSTPTATQIQNNSTVFTQEVNPSSFEQSKSLEKVDNEQVSLSDKIFFIPGGQVGFFNQDYKLRIANQDIAGSPVFFPSQIYNSPDGIIINSDTFSTAYLKNGQFKDYASGILQITPILVLDDLGFDSTPGYVFLSKESDVYTLKQSTSVDLSANLKTITTFTPDSEFRYIEIRLLNNNIYTVWYQNASREGDMQIWKLTDTKLQKVQTISSVKSMIFGDKKLIYTLSSDKLPEVTNYQSSILDFSSKAEGEVHALDIDIKLVQNNILGSLYARRCSFAVSDSILYCLVKGKKVNSDVFQLKDALVKINLSTTEVSLPLSGLVFSASSVTVSNNGSIYLAGQENNILYRVKT